jgi:hypothetical protein
MRRILAILSLLFFVLGRELRGVIRLARLAAANS